jgi:hypothetical protein
MDDGDVDGGGLVGEADIARLRLGAGLDEAGDGDERGVVRPAQGFQGQRARQIEGAGVAYLADADGDRRRLAGEQAVVEL